jgi:sodium/hydrogen exchanger 10/11
LLFGAVISATDPVAVVSLLKELGAPKSIGTLIEGESLLNDGTAVVIFFITIEFLTGNKMT